MRYWSGVVFKSFSCDFCKVEVSGTPPIELQGVIEALDTITPTKKFQYRDFCSSKCFWNWVEKYNPNKIKGGN